MSGDEATLAGRHGAHDLVDAGVEVVHVGDERRQSIVELHAEDRFELVDEGRGHLPHQQRIGPHVGVLAAVVVTGLVVSGLVVVVVGLGAGLVGLGVRSVLERRFVLAQGTQGDVVGHVEHRHAVVLRLAECIGEAFLEVEAVRHDQGRPAHRLDIARRR